MEKVNELFMSLKIKALIIGVVVLLFTILGLIAYNQYNISKRQAAIEMGIVGQKELADKIMRSQSEYATKKDIQDFAKENGVNVSEINKDLKNLGAEISSVNTVKVVSVGTNLKNVKSTSDGNKNPTPTLESKCINGKCENPDKFGYLNQEKKLKLEEPFSDGTKVPLGDVGFSAWQKDPWSLKLSPREYGITTVVATDEQRRHFIYNQVVVKVNGKSYLLPITTAETKQQYPAPHFKWFNPSLNLGIAAGTYLNQFQSEFLPNLSISFMSYGTYDHQPDLKILDIGVGYGVIDENVHLDIAPIMYNVANHLPLMDNLYVGPIFSVTPIGEPAVFVGAFVGL